MNIPGVFALSSAQRGMWFAQHLAGHTPISIAQYVEVEGQLDIDALVTAATTAGREFGTGYLGIVEIDGLPWQSIDPSIDDSVPYVDLRTEADPIAAAHDWMRREYTTPIDLLTDRLVAMAVLRVGEAHTFWYSRIHHIALDGVGAMTLLQRCAELYTAAASGAAAPPCPADDLRTIVDSDVAYRASSRFDADREYWIEHLTGLAEPVSLAGRSSSAVGHPRLRTGSLNNHTSDMLDAVAAELQSSTAPVTVAAFASYLARSTGSTEVTLSLPVSARTTASLRRSGGMVANVVPLRLGLGAQTTVADAVRAAQLELTGALRRQRYRQEDIARDLGVEASSFGPSVNMMMFDTRITLGPFVGRLHVLTSGMIDDLFVNVYPGIGGSSTHIDFQANPELYSDDELTRHHTGFLEFLDRFLADGTARVCTLEMVAEPVDGLGPAPSPPHTLDRILTEAAATDPDAIAVIAGADEYTYGRLNRDSNRLARRLIARGARTETAVAVSIPRSYASVVALWAVAKTGAAFVPVDPAYPHDRIEYMLTDSGALFTVTDSDVADIDVADFGIENEPDHALAQHELSSPIHVQNTAYIIYTSGSTGKPKGVRVGHGGLTNVISDGIERLALTPSSRMTHGYSPSFDASLSELLVTFGAGATSIIVPPNVFGGDELAAVLTQGHVTHIDVTPAVLGTLNVSELPDLTHVIVGGDACPPELRARWAGEVSMYNGYGPTEMTITSTFSDPMKAADPVTIGRPIRGTGALVLDRWLKPVPVGGTGELYLFGPGIARGYHQRPGLTASRFLANPVGAGAGSGMMYRTGDLVRWTESLELDYIGRSDFQVKIRGFRIELGEIDAALAVAADITFALTVGHETTSGATVLVSYVQCALGAVLDPAALTAALAALLPAYMVPSSIMILDSVPLTPVGKVDRRALPEPVFAAARTSRGPSTPREKTLAGLFAHVLNVPSVGVDDSFFALGGDSIVSIQLVSRAKAAGLVFTARDVFERKTVAALGEVATDTVDAPVLIELAGGAVGIVDPTPIVAAMIATGSYQRYCQAVSITLPAGVENDSLIRAIQTLVDHHGALRSRLTDTWEILPTLDASTLFSHTTGSPDDALDRAADRLNPAEGIVAQFVRVDNGDPAESGLLWFVVHHLAVDGVSWRILLPDLVAAYTGAELASGGTSLRRWARGLTEHAPDRTRELASWQRITSTAEPLIGTRALDPAVDTASAMATTALTIPADVTDSLLATVPDRFLCGPNDALLTALAMAIGRWTGRSESLVTLEGHGREQQTVPGADIAKTVGWFTTVYPVSLDLTGIDIADAYAAGESAGRAIKAVKEQLAALADHGIGYGMLRYLGGHEELDVTPQISFNYLGRIAVAAGVPWMPERLESRQGADMPLAAVVDINAIAEKRAAGTELVVTWAYASNILSARDVEDFAALFGDAAAALAQYAESESSLRHSPSDFPLVPTTQREIDMWENEFPTLTDIWPLSPLQAGLLFHAVFDAEGPDSYIVQSVLTLAGIVDAERLHDAAQALVDRHENLRVAYRELDSGPRQIVIDVVDIEWSETDLRGRENPETEMEQILETDRATRFDMARPPLMRFDLVRTGEDAYKLLMTNHHILLDGWSTPLLVQELLTLYAAFDGVGGLRPARSYREYLAWLGTQDMPRSRAAWRNALDGVDSPTLVYPAVRLTADTESGEQSLRLGAELTGALHGLSRSHGVTVNTAVQAAWALLISSLTGRTDVIFGGTVSGRPPALPGVEEMVGLFINTLPVRVRLRPDESVADLLTRIQLDQAELLDHQHVGLSEIHELVGLPELFDTMTVFESYPVDRAALAASLDLAGMRVLDAEGTDATPYPLSLLVIPGDSMQITLKYLTSALSAERAATLLEDCRLLLTRIAEDPDAPVSAVSPAGTGALVHGGTGTEPRTLPMILRSTAFAHSARTALSMVGTTVPTVGTTMPTMGTTMPMVGTTMTYRELDTASNALARMLTTWGARPETFVALALPRSVAGVVAMWAVAKTGAAFVPIDPKLPPDRIDAMLRGCGATLGVAPEGVLTSLPEYVRWVTPAAALDYSSAPLDVPEPHLDNLAYLIFTSGSTGTPKAVAVSHRGLANFVLAQAEEFRVEPESRILHFASPSFDAAVSECLMAFGSGAHLVIAPTTVLGGDDLAALIESERVTHMVITPAALATVDPIDSVRVLAVAGEAPGREVIERWSAARLMMNHYGPTEFTIWATGSGPLGPDTPVTIGSPIRGASALVLDTWLRPVPDGIAGELYLSGPGLARGYQNRRDLTSARFVADPFDPGSRMYRTGDVVRWVDGELDYLGRSDFQVKIRGFRVELGEIDAVLTGVETVDFATTIGCEGPGGATVLVSYVLLAPGTSIDAEWLRQYTSERLPGYMVPTSVEILDAIPLTAVGKLDVKALPRPDFGSRRRAFRAPRTPLEGLITGVFTEVLECGEVGIDDSFFDLGGNSLVATRVVARINAAAGSAVALRDLFEAPTAAALAGRVDQDGGVHAPRLHLVAGSRPERIPLSLSQQRMWFLNRFDSESAAYNMPMAIGLTGTLDVAALARAVSDVTARHEVLRTVYPQTDDGPVQVVLPPDPLQLKPIDVKAADLEARIFELATLPFDVTAQVPLRGSLFRLSEDEHVIVMVVHHIAADGWSFGPLARDLMIAYTARKSGTSPGWLPLSIQYADYALWQRELLGSEDDPDSLASQQLKYWSEELAGLPDMIELPTDRPRPAQQTYRGARVPFSIDTRRHQRIVDMARDNGTSLFMLLHSAFAVLLARLGNSSDVAIGSPIAGRGEQALDDLIGMFVGTVVFRTRVSSDVRFDALLARTRESDLQAFAHADMPFERLVEVLAPARSTARHPLFQIGFSFENLAPTSFELPELTVSRVEIDSATSQFDLHLIVVETPGEGVDGYFTYATDLFDAATVERIGSRLLTVLDAVVADPSTIVGDIDLLSSAETTRVLDDRNRTSQQVAASTLASMVAETAARHPDAVAVVGDGERLTHAEFSRSVNRLARYLIDSGVGPESLVAVAMRRSVAQLIALHAIVAAGGGYVPIDLSHPADRIALVLDSANPVAVLTTAADGFGGAVIVDSLDLSHYDDTPVTDADRLSPLIPSNIAYVLFTSGSTGVPKGVTLSHSAVANQLLWMTSEYSLTEADRFLVMTPATFDVSVWQYWSPFVAGGCAVLAADGPLEPSYVNALIANEEITVISTVPSVLDALLGACDGAMGSSVRHILAIGEALPSAVAARLSAGPRLHNLYGPTEAAVSITAYTVDGSETTTVPIGVPEWNSRVYVLDERLHPVPGGVAGELYLAGDQLARGYFGRSTITSDRFLADPFGAPGSRMYRTGDLVTWGPRGQLEYLGRTDFQVKMRGFRIELGDIENALTRIDGVRHAVVTLHTGDVGEQLVAYIVPGGAGPQDVAAQIAAAVPSYMVPSAIVTLDRFPVNINGKVDRKALPAPTVLVAEFRPPTTVTEVAVASAFSSVLHRSGIGCADDFFALGGNSLLATRVADMLRTSLGVQVSVAWMFTAPTVAGLAERIDSAEPDVGGDPLGVMISLQKGRTGPTLFCIHPASGLSWCYAGLSAHAPSFGNVYGIQSPELGAREPAPFSIAAIAERYVREIRSIQPHGPYNLLGWSFGGFLAHAVASRLRELGDSVGLVAMLDPNVESCSLVPEPPMTTGAFFAEFAPILGFDGIDPTVTAEEAAAMVRAKLGAEIDADQIHALAASYNNSLALLQGYEPPMFDGDVIFFTASGPDVESASRSWEPYVSGRIENHLVDADHDSMTETAALAAVAAILDAHLRTHPLAAAS